MADRQQAPYVQLLSLLPVAYEAWAFVALQVKRADHLLLLEVDLVEEEVGHQSDGQLDLPALIGHLQHGPNLLQKRVASDLFE